jgi:hypothetical protein
MIDQGDLPRPPEPALTPEQLRKCDLDIETISKLGELANQLGGKLILNGGYAVEALLGGAITRPHGDIDVALNLPSEDIEESARNGAIQIIEDEKTYTNWVETPDSKNRGHFIEYREENSEIPEFKDRRRIELYTFDQVKGRKLVDKVLVDSQGIEHRVIVPTLEEVVADKVRIFNRDEEKEENKDKRRTTQTDIDDFNRLIKSDKFNKERYLETMAGYLVYRSEVNLSHEDALTEAERQFQNAIEITSAPLQSSSQ